MPSRTRDTLHASFEASPSAHDASASAASGIVVEKLDQRQGKSNSNSTTQPQGNKSTKWYHPANLLKITAEPVIPSARNPAEKSSKGDGDMRRGPVRLQDQRRGYLGELRVVGYVRV